MSFDLDSLALKETFTLHLKHPVDREPLFAKGEDGKDDESKPVTIELYGSSSKPYRKAVTSMQNRELKRKARKENANADTIRSEGVELLVACSASSTNLSMNGSDVETADDFRTLYSTPKYSWVKDQVDEAIGDTSNFLSQ